MCNFFRLKFVLKPFPQRSNLLWKLKGLRWKEGKKKRNAESHFRQVLGVFFFWYLMTLISRSLNVIYGIQMMDFPMSLSCFKLSPLQQHLELWGPACTACDPVWILIHPISQFNHIQIVWKGFDPTRVRSHTFFTQMFSCLRSSSGTAHSLLSFSPLHQRLIILSHGMEAVNGDTHYESGVKDGWRSLHSLFI